MHEAPVSRSFLESHASKSKGRQCAAGKRLWFPPGLPRWDHNWRATNRCANHLGSPPGLSRWKQRLCGSTVMNRSSNRQLNSRVMNELVDQHLWPNHDYTGDSSGWDEVGTESELVASQSLLPPGQARRRTLFRGGVLVAAQSLLPPGQARRSALFRRGELVDTLDGRGCAPARPSGRRPAKHNKLELRIGPPHE